MENIRERISRLKKERNAVILAHYYAAPEVQDVADFLGDSLGLSRLAATTDASAIIFGGVHFMAETAAIISPEKRVFAPAPDAGCSLADSVDAAALRKWKEAHPEGIIVSYVNTTAAVKAETDYCCTSANAVKVIQALPENRGYVEENGKETLAQVFTDIRYTKQNNEIFSVKFLETLKSQGFDF